MSIERRQDYKNIDDLVTQALLATKKENSGLIKGFTDKIDNFGKHFVKIDTRLEGMVSRLDIANHKAAQHEMKINALTNWRNYITGGLAVIVIMLIPLLFMFLSYKMKDTESKITRHEVEQMVENFIDNNYTQ